MDKQQIRALEDAVDDAQATLAQTQRALVDLKQRQAGEVTQLLEQHTQEQAALIQDIKAAERSLRLAQLELDDAQVEIPAVVPDPTVIEAEPVATAPAGRLARIGAALGLSALRKS